MLTKMEAVDALESARDLISEALELIRSTEPSPYMQSTVLAQIEHFIGEGGWLGDEGQTIDAMIEAVMDGEEEPTLGED